MELYAGPILQAKAKQLHEKICKAEGGSKKSVASSGWLWRFSQQHGICQLLMQGEKLSADTEAAEDFVTFFKQF